MRIERASSKAIKYACENFHYAKKKPAIIRTAHAIFEEHIWCGVVSYGNGAINLGNQFNLKDGQILELNRVALNGKQKYTSECLAASLKRLKKEAPLVKLVVSYADKGQSHRGTIYQATNWKLIEDIHSSGTEYFYKGQWMHDRDKYVWKVDFRTLPKRKKAGKYKYVYFFDKRLEKQYTFLPYPKPEK